MRSQDIAVAVMVLSLVACKSVDTPIASDIDTREEFEHCTPENPATWQVIARPADAMAILAIPNEKGTLDSELRPGGAVGEVHEHWFGSGDSRMAICRHLPVGDSCHSGATLVYLTKVDGKWEAPNGVLESICLVHERVR